MNAASPEDLRAALDALEEAHRSIERRERRTRWSWTLAVALALLNLALLVAQIVTFR